MDARSADAVVPPADRRGAASASRPLRRVRARSGSEPQQAPTPTDAAGPEAASPWRESRARATPEASRSGAVAQPGVGLRSRCRAGPRSRTESSPARRAAAERRPPACLRHRERAERLRAGSTAPPYQAASRGQLPRRAWAATTDPSALPGSLMSSRPFPRAGARTMGARRALPTRPSRQTAWRGPILARRRTPRRPRTRPARSRWTAPRWAIPPVGDPRSAFRRLPLPSGAIYHAIQARSQHRTLRAPGFPPRGLDGRAIGSGHAGPSGADKGGKAIQSAGGTT